MNKTQEKQPEVGDDENDRQKQTNGVRTRYKRNFFALCGVSVLAIVFLLGYAASHNDAPEMVKRLLIPPQQPKGMLRVALCQYSTRSRALEWNLEHAVAWAEEAFEQGAHYVILPEFSFSGLSELSRMHALIAEFELIDGEETLQKVARRNRGYLQYNQPALTDNVFWNETVLLDPNGEIVARYHKRYLATIDHLVQFVKGRTPMVVDLPFGRIAFLICSDVAEASIVERGLLAASTAADTNIYENAYLNLKQYREADLVVGQLAFASWWTPNRSVMVTDSITNAIDRMGQEADIWARQTRTHVVLVNKSGFEQGHGFTGGSLLVDPDGNILGEASSGTEIVYVDLPLDETGRITHPHSRCTTKL